MADGSLKVEAPPARDSNEDIVDILSCDKSVYCAEFVQDFTIKFIFKDPIALIGYGFQTGQDHVKRDPKNWSIIGMRDGELTEIDQRDNHIPFER